MLDSLACEARFISTDIVGLLDLRRLRSGRSLVQTMLGLLELRRPRLARSLAKFASLARAAGDLAWRLFGWRSLLGLPGVSP